VTGSCSWGGETRESRGYAAKRVDKLFEAPVGEGGPEGSFKGLALWVSKTKKKAHKQGRFTGGSKGRGQGKGKVCICLTSALSTRKNEATCGLQKKQSSKKTGAGDCLLYLTVGVRPGCVGRSGKDETRGRRKKSGISTTDVVHVWRKIKRKGGGSQKKICACWLASPYRVTEKNRRFLYRCLRGREGFGETKVWGIVSRKSNKSHPGGKSTYCKDWWNYRCTQKPCLQC